MHVRTPPFAGPESGEWRALSKQLQEEIENWVVSGNPRYEFMVQFDGNTNPCIWLDLITGGCRHYELRPAVCREFEVGCKSCRAMRQTVGLTVKGLPVVVEDY